MGLEMDAVRSPVEMGLAIDGMGVGEGGLVVASPRRATRLWWGSTSPLAVRGLSNRSSLRAARRGAAAGLPSRRRAKARPDNATDDWRRCREYPLCVDPLALGGETFEFAFLEFEPDLTRGALYSPPC